MKIGFIGGGQIATALAAGFQEKWERGTPAFAVLDRIAGSADAFAGRFAASTAATAVELAAGAEVVFLCVKPPDAAGVLTAEVGRALDGKLLISVAAGIPLSSLAGWVGADCGICRAMPNTAAEIGRSASALCFTDNTSESQRQTARDLFACAGEVFELPEKLFDAFVGVAGSGPAYACLLIEAMSDGAVKTGMPRNLATRLAALAVEGAAGLVLQTGRHPAEIREKISSPGGTTIAALEQLERGAVRSHVAAAVEAAAVRSKELGSN